MSGRTHTSDDEGALIVTLFYALLPLIAGLLGVYGTFRQFQTERAERNDIWQLSRERDRLAEDELKELRWWQRWGRAKREASARVLVALNDAEKHALEVHDKRLDGWTALLLSAFLLVVLGIDHLMTYLLQ